MGRLGGDQPIAAEVVVGRGIEVDQPLPNSCITAMAVKVLVMEPIRKTVSSVTGVFDAMSANPCPWKNSRRPLRTTPTARPTVGQRLRIRPILALNSS